MIQGNPGADQCPDGSKAKKKPPGKLLRERSAMGRDKQNKKVAKRAYRSTSTRLPLGRSVRPGWIVTWDVGEEPHLHATLLEDI